MTRFEKLMINIAYVSIALTVLGQVTVGHLFYVGQSAYLVANVINCTRDVMLGRPRADKVKNFTFLGITIGLIVLNAIRGQKNENYRTVQVYN